MQPFQYDLRCPAVKDNSVTHAAETPSNLDTVITLRSAQTEVQNTLELRATASEIAAPKPDLDAKPKKTILKHGLKGISTENHQRQNSENPITNHYRSLDAAIPIRVTMSSCKRQ